MTAAYDCDFITAGHINSSGEMSAVKAAGNLSYRPELVCKLFIQLVDSFSTRKEFLFILVKRI